MNTIVTIRRIIFTEATIPAAIPHLIIIIIIIIIATVADQEAITTHIPSLITMKKK